MPGSQPISENVGNDKVPTGRTAVVAFHIGGSDTLTGRGDSVLGELKKMMCPKCKGQPLTSASVQGIEVDRCRNCDGIWFDSEELTAVLELDKRSRRGLQSKHEDALRDQARGQCPRDQSKLVRMYSAHAESVVLDTCPACGGIWLDAGELAKLSS